MMASWSKYFYITEFCEQWYVLIEQMKQLTRPDQVEQMRELHLRIRDFGVECIKRLEGQDRDDTAFNDLRNFLTSGVYALQRKSENMVSFHASEPFRLLMLDECCMYQDDLRVLYNQCRQELLIRDEVDLRLAAPLLAVG